MHVGEIAWPEEVIPATLVFRNEHFACTACTDNGVSTNNVIGGGGGESVLFCARSPALTLLQYTRQYRSGKYDFFPIFFF